jgi:hypothetical protein
MAQISSADLLIDFLLFVDCCLGLIDPRLLIMRFRFQFSKNKSIKATPLFPPPAAAAAAAAAD